MTGKNDPAQIRLTELLTLLPQLEEEEETLNSRLIGRYLNATPDSVRKDISRLNREGRSGAYEGKDLSEGIRELLGLEGKKKVCLAGLGSLGLHIMELLENSEHVELVAAFDSKMNRVERTDATVELFPAWEIPEITARYGVEAGIIATEPEDAEKTLNRMSEGGVRGILNLSGWYLPRDEEGPSIKNVNIGAMLLELLCRMK
ncbi:MAG: winged-helix domain-containing protein [Spirochaetales bacterium]|nr:winged-helix domain-containing protein [Spirochaetales bacterium]